MKVRELIEALNGHGIKVRSMSHSGGNTVYTFEGYVPEFPFGPLCLTSYPLVIDDDNPPLEPHKIDKLLRHFWKSQVELAQHSSRNR